MNLEAKIGEYVGLVHGRFADVEGMPAGTTGLIRPTSIHRGVKRDLHNGHASVGDEVLIYVTEPPCTYKYPLNARHGGVPTIEPKPVSSIFTTFVSLDASCVDAAIAAMHKAPDETIDGVVLNWEWTLCPPGRGLLAPDSRYEERLL